MKAFVRIVVRLLLLGAATSVAVTWTHSVLIDLPGGPRRQGTPSEEQIAIWRDQRPASYPDAPLRVIESRGIGIRENHLVAYGPPGRDGDRDMNGLRVRDYGWPFLALRYSEWWDEDGGIHHNALLRVRPIFLHRDRPVRYTHLPLDPLWFGFVGNTLFYAAVFLCTLPAWRFLRSTIRVARSRCPRCSYPVGVSPVCTECGGQLSERLLERARDRRARGADRPPVPAPPTPTETR